MSMLRDKAGLRWVAGFTALPLLSPGIALAASAEGEAAGGPGLPQLDFSTYPSQLFWLLISFVVLYILMSRVAMPRIAEVLEERQSKIADDLDKAESLKTNAEQVKAEYEKAVADARSEAHAVNRKTADEITAANAEAEAEAGREIAKKIQDAEASIEKARAEALSNVKTVATEVAGVAVDKLIGVSVGADEVQAAVDASAGRAV